MDHTLWWFNGENPGGSYHVTTTLVAQAVTTGTFVWEVIWGADKVDLCNDGAVADALTTTDDNTIEVISTAASAPAESVTSDVIIRLVYNGTEVWTRDLAVFAPHRQIHLNDSDSPSGVGYSSRITYELRDQFNQRMPYFIPWNEDIDGNEVHSNATTVSAAAITIWENENWGWGSEGSALVSPSAAVDVIEYVAPDKIPTVENPHGGNEPVDRSPSGAWYVGSATIGKGVRVGNCVWKRYRDHSRHE